MNGTIETDFLGDIVASLASEPPTSQLIDWIEFVYLIGLFAIGAPLNSAIYVALNEKSHLHRRGVRRLDTLKRHMNYCDLLLMFVYIPTRLCWTITYQWRGGPFLCKLVKFAHNLAFQMSSNVIVCVSADRVFSIMSASLIIHGERAEKRVRLMLRIAWAVAVTLSLPHFVAYTTFGPGTRFEQCSTVWDANRYSFAMALYRSVLNDVIHNNYTVKSYEQFFSTDLMQLHAIQPTEMAFFVQHQLCVSALPVLLIAGCYLYVTLKVVSLKHHTEDSVDPVGRRRRARRWTSSTGFTRLSSFFTKRKSEDEPSGGEVVELTNGGRVVDFRRPFSIVDELHSAGSFVAHTTRRKLNSIKQHFTVQFFMHPDVAQKLIDEQPSDVSERRFQSCSEFQTVYFTTKLDQEDESRKSFIHLQSVHRRHSLPLKSWFGVDETGFSGLQPVRLNGIISGSHPDLITINAGPCGSDSCIQTESTRIGSEQSSGQSQRQSTTQVSLHSNVLRIKKKTLRMSGLLVLAYIILWLPYNMLTTASLVYPHLADEFKRSYYFFKDLVALNAVINPFLYGMFGSLKRWARTA